MLPHNPSFFKTLNPYFSTFTKPYPLPTKFSNPLYKTLIPFHSSPQISSLKCLFQPKPNNASCTPDVRSYAGRSKKQPGGTSTGRIEGNAELRREAKRNARRKSKKLAENLFYRLKNPHGNYPNNFSEEELQMIGLGYDRMVQFMEKDDPNLKHPYDWYKYGEFGPYSWRGVVLGEPIRGRFSDENVTLIGEVRDQEEWEKIEQFEMSQDFGQRMESMDRNVGFRYFWVFVRHPKWRVSELPWEQWTLVSEVVVESGKQRLDKWNLMGRLGNQTRSLITKCAAWMRPDIIYVKRPVYQCRFEPQDEFFKAMVPLLDPASEQDFMCELESDDGGVEMCTYFGGLCKILRVNPKAFVDDVVKAFEKASDEKKSKCLEFVLGNHPIELLHPYTKEWKAKLEDMELGCDAPDEIDDGGSKTEVLDWIEDDDDDEDEDDIVVDAELSEVEDDDDDGDDDDDDGSGLEEDEKYWEGEFEKAVNKNEEMEVMARRSVQMTTKLYEKQSRVMEEKERKVKEENENDDRELRGRAKISPEEWEKLGYGPRMKKIKKSRIPPGQFLRAAVRPFRYKNLVKEIVLTRHAIVEGEIGGDKKK
ncbi:uncharacterized protein LOC112500965 [Cynara cardunculus var. scolymus]|uniref:uncharacterized protein LOC112500965 n=1 Tax=Cynara cardunculus var. scolymus TaxID=59895 RepID=UPI000D62ED11|nr:uncharacterized protein LOC112500965 [Cynara cardunculus var. scolymus]